MTPQAVQRLRLARRRLDRGDLLRSTLITLALLVAVALIALMSGSDGIHPGNMIRAIFSGGLFPTHRTILVDIRLPRVLLTIGAGGALAASGVVFQALLRNPLAEPYILGVSNGCAVGAILGLMIGAGALGVPALSILGGMVAVLTVLGIGRSSHSFSSDTMLLGGVMVAALGASMIFLLLYLLGPRVRSAIEWMLGNLGGASHDVAIGASLLFVAVVALAFVAGNTLNALAMGDEEATSLGLNVPRVRRLVYLAGSVVVGLTVAFCGAIGFVGLVVPHIVRRVVGVDHRVLLPVSAIAGGVFLLVCDTLSRTLMPALGASMGELPIGAVTALVGAPLFIQILKRQHRRDFTS